MSTAFVNSVHRAERSIAAARALFAAGLTIDCHLYMARALHSFLHAWAGDEAIETKDTHADAERISERGLLALEHAGYRRIGRLRAALSAAKSCSSDQDAARPLPDVEWIWAEVEHLAGRSARHAMGERARKFGRVRIAASLGLALLVVVVLLSRVWGRPRVHASDIISAPHSASNVIDGLEATEWLLPDATAGWVDVIFPSARTVHEVTLVNSHNVFYLDRAAQAVRVTAFTERGRAVSVEGAFARLSADRSTIELPLEAAQVVRIRVDVLTHFKLGGGLAEIEVH